VAVAYVDKATTVEDTSGANTTGNYPASCDAGDVLVAVFAYRSSSGGISWPSGWTQFQSYDYASGLAVWAAWYVCDGSEDGGTYTVTHGSTTTLRVLETYRFSGADTVMPIDVGSHSIARGTDSSVEHATVATLDADRLAVAITCVAADTTVGDFASESGGAWVEQTEYATASGSDATVSLATASMASAGSLSSGVATLGGAATWACITFALSPAITRAIAFDAESEAEGTSLSWTHTPAGTPRGVLVAVVEAARSTVGVTAVTYGGVSMSKVTDAADTSGEPGAVSVWFLGESVPTGAKTVSVTAGADAKWGSCVTVTADGDLQVADSDRVQEDAANPTVTLQTGAGVESFVAAWAYSGLGAVTNLSANTTRYQEKLANSRDFGSYVAVGVRGQGSYLGGDIPVGFTSSSDDMAMAAVALAAIPDSPTGGPAGIRANGQAVSRACTV